MSGELEMDPGLEEELCMLWDASVNSVGLYNIHIVRLYHQVITLGIPQTPSSLFF